MSDPAHIDVVKPEELTAEDIALWQSFVAMREDLQGPYFDVRYAQAAGQVVPEARIARLKNNEGRVIGYLPYQVRGRTLQPLGAPMSDYHGLISANDTHIDYRKVLKKLKASRLEYAGWVGEIDDSGKTVQLVSQVADLSDGYDAYLARHSAESIKFYKNVARCQRNVEKDFGGFTFNFGMVTPEVLRWVTELKRQQYVRSGMHDVFACGWTFDLLLQLAQIDDADYGLRVGTLHHGEVLVAAEICLLNGHVLHLWFPAYAESYQRYSPGILLSLRIMEYMSGRGVTKVDFGAGGEGYKHTMTSPGAICLEGSVRTQAAILSLVADTVEALTPVAKGRVKGVRLSLNRRLRIIRACETESAGRKAAFRGLWRRAISRLSRSRRAA
ncbi:MAG: GNAT family N-acetyltransferase [Asticcacaulis sp.]